MTQTDDISDARLLARLSDLVASATGLHFPPSRWPELRRGIAAVADKFGFDGVVDCAQALLTSSLTVVQMEELVDQLTVAETYFFRDDGVFDALAEQIIPQFLRERSSGTRRPLRIWSAACCTGEEPYSIAILLRELIPNLDDWNLTILATDINPRVLHAAEAGVFGKWSFRNTPDRIKLKYFTPTTDGRFEVIPEVKRLVRFAQLNLVDNCYPSVANDTVAMDVIFCRNVLIYFDAGTARQVIEHLSHAQSDGSWLIVSPTELSHIAGAPYTMVNRPGAILCRKGCENASAALPHPSEPPMLSPVMEDIALPQSRKRLDDPAPSAEVVQSLADRGDLEQALSCCDEWIASSSLDAVAHYLRAVILQELDVIDEASRSLRRALYLDPSLVLAHFALAQIARGRGLPHQVDKHLDNACRLANRFAADDVLPHSGGITAGGFAKMIGRMQSLSEAA